MNRLFLYLLVCIVFASCSGNKDQGTIFSKMLKAEEIVIPESDVLNLKSYYLTASYEHLLYGYNRKEHALDVFDLQTLISKQIVMDFEGSDAVIGDVRALFVSSPDSIWLCDEALHIMLLDSKGKTFRILSVSDYLYEGETALIERNHAMSTAQFFYDKQTERILFGIRAHNAKQNGFLLRAVSLKSGDIIDYALDNSISVPDVAGGMYANMSKPNIAFADGKVVYNYPVESHVYVLDLGTGESTIYNGDSSFTKNIAEKCRNISDYNEWQRHGIENPHFFEVMYLSDLQLYVRMHLGEHALSSESNLTKVNDGRDLYLTIFDKHFIIKEEIKLPSYRYSYYTGWCSFPDGFCIFVDNSLGDSVNTEQLVMDYFKGVK